MAEVYRHPRCIGCGKCHALYDTSDFRHRPRRTHSDTRPGGNQSAEDSWLRVPEAVSIVSTDQPPTDWMVQPPVMVARPRVPHLTGEQIAAPILPIEAPKSPT